MKKRILAYAVIILSVVYFYSPESLAEDKWWERTPEYQRCYGKVTQAHKASGLHDRNRAMSIKIKEQICKDAVITKGASGGHWLK